MTSPPLVSFGLVAGLCALACTPAGEPREERAPNAPAAAAATEDRVEPPSWETIERFAFREIAGQEIQLAGGSWKGPPFEPGGPASSGAMLLRDARVDADLDRDGNLETYVLVSYYPGGSGELVHLAAIALRDGAWRNTATVLLGDRVKIRRFDAEGETLVVRSVEAETDAPRCCPTRKIRRSFGWRDGALVELVTEDEGEISLADLGGVEWVLERIDFHESVADEIRPTAIFAAGGLRGSAGCNEYQADLRSDEPMTLGIEPTISTRRACGPPQMELEARYLDALRNTIQFTFLAGKLAMTYRTSDETFGTLVFRRAQAPV